MNRRLIIGLFIGLSIHLVLSIVYIFNGNYELKDSLSVFYRMRVLPGPFFSEKRIADTYHCTVSWKVLGQWSASINPPEENFRLYHQTFEPGALYRHRLERSLFQGLFLDAGTATPNERSRELGPLISYLKARYVPANSDSVQLWITRKSTKDFKTTVDTLAIIKAK